MYRSEYPHIPWVDRHRHAPAVLVQEGLVAADLMIF